MKVVTREAKKILFRKESLKIWLRLLRHKLHFKLAAMLCSEMFVDHIHHVYSARYFG